MVSLNGIFILFKNLSHALYYGVPVSISASFQ